MRLCGMRLRLARLCGILWLPALAAEGTGAPPPPALWPSDAAELLGEALARHHMMSNSGAPSDGGNAFEQVRTDPAGGEAPEGALLGSLSRALELSSSADREQFWQHLQQQGLWTDDEPTDAPSAPEPTTAAGTSQTGHGGAEVAVGERAGGRDGRGAGVAPGGLRGGDAPRAQGQRQRPASPRSPPNNEWGVESSARRRTQAGMLIGSCVNDTELSDNTLASDLEVRVEIDASSDLNLLIGHVARILLQDKMGFNVTLVPRHNSHHSIQRVSDGDVHLNFQVGLESARDYALYTKLVERDELTQDLGATGFSTTSGLFLANSASLDPVIASAVASSGGMACMYRDYWRTYTKPHVLQHMLSVHDVLPGMEHGSVVCNASRAAQGFCTDVRPGHAGKYYSSSACDSDGYSRKNSSRPCRALLAHYPHYESAVVEQLVNNLGHLGFEFGVVWLGANATNEIMHRAQRGEIFLFHHWYPATLFAGVNSMFTRLDLPTHDRGQWSAPSSALPTGPISTSFLPTVGLKLMNAAITTLVSRFTNDSLCDLLPYHVAGTPCVENTGALLKDFVQNFVLLEEHVDQLLALANYEERGNAFACAGIETQQNCTLQHEQIACSWVQQHPIVWDVFMPAHKHCDVGEHVDVNGALEARCVPCEVGRYQGHTSNLHQCRACEAGKYADATGSEICTGCSAGRYGTLEGAGASSQCNDCAVGRFQPQSGSTSCDDCAPGQFQASRAKAYCYACSTGEYQPFPRSTNCSSCPESEKACAVVLTTDGKLTEVCQYKQSARESCVCNAGLYRNSSGGCSPCPEGAYCCMCPEVAGCYDPAMGPCNLTRLELNAQRCNSTCCGPDEDGEPDSEVYTVSDGPYCVSGTPKPLAQPGFFEHAPSGWHPHPPGYNLTSSERFKDYLAAAKKTGENSSENVFLACNLFLPTTKLRTAVDWEYQGCLGGPPDLSIVQIRSDPGAEGNRCAGGNFGWLCGGCPEGWFRVTTGRCIECQDTEWAWTLMTTLLVIGFFVVIPVLFNVIYYMVSDKNAAQYMVYVRLVVDLCVVLFLVYSSLLRYWPRELLWGWQRTDGHSQMEDISSLFFGLECGYNWGFEKRYLTYLFLPFILVCGLSFQIVFVWFVYTYDNTEILVDGDDDPRMAWKLMLLNMSSQERKEALTMQNRAEDMRNEPSPDDIISYQELVNEAEELKPKLEVMGVANRKGNCLNSIARCLGSCLPDGRTPRGARIAWAAPKEQDGWNRFVNHCIQVYTFLLVLLYITLVNYSLTVFDCSTSNQHSALGNYKYMEWEPTIRCSWDDPVWPRVAVIGGILGGFYTVMIPGGLLITFLMNKEAAMRGDMAYLQKFGFLLKPYKPEAYYWEIVNLSRKGFLSCIIKLTTSTPFMCGCYALAVLCVIIAQQAHVRPYKYEKHNTAAVCVLGLGVLNFFSSLIFISDVATLSQNRVLLIMNAIFAFWMVVWVFGGAAKDILMYLRFQVFIFRCESTGRADIEVESMWLAVDKPGLVTLKWYDMLVTRNRYSHLVTHTTRLTAADEAAAKQRLTEIKELMHVEKDKNAVKKLTAEKKELDDTLMIALPVPKDKEKEELRGEDWGDEERIPTRIATMDQNAAHNLWQGFHASFARFVADIRRRRIAPNYLEELATRDKETKSARLMFMEMDEDGGGSLDRKEIKELCCRLNPKLKITEEFLNKAMNDMDEDGSGEVDLEEFTQWWATKGSSKSSSASDGVAAERISQELADEAAAFAEGERDTGACSSCVHVCDHIVKVSSCCPQWILASTSTISRRVRSC
jgi:hypothetical protein